MIDGVVNSEARRFRDRGYAILPSFLLSGELPQIASAVEEIIAAPPPHSGMCRPGNDLFPLRWNDGIVAHVLGSERHLRQLGHVLEPRDLKFLSAYISTKQPHTPPLWWHQDWWCWDHPISFRPSAVQVALLCYLTDTDARSGALRILPGSHYASMPIHAMLPEPHGDHANGLPADHPAMADLPEQVTLELKAGDAVVIDYRLLHGTHANAAPQRRDCILLSFIPAWRDLATELKAHLIAHPALPDASEAAKRLDCGYDALLPRFFGEIRDMPINRLPPPHFAACDGEHFDTHTIDRSDFF